MAQYRSRKAFTLIEILIVVVILGILAGIIVPQFATATADAKKVSAANTVQALRSQLALYRIEHRDENPTPSQLWSNLVSKTDEQGNVGVEAAHRYGPYLLQEPRNPYNGLNTVDVVSAPGVIPTEADLNINTVGFLYDAYSGRIWATTGK